MSNQLQITAKPNPVTQETLRCLIEAGKTISELFPDISPQAQVEINGELLPPDQYDSYALAKDDIVVIKVFPAGSTDARKDAARIAGIIALTVASAALGQPAATASVWTKIGYGAAHLTAAVGSSLLYSSITFLEPQQPENDEINPDEFNRMGALTGSKNKLSPWSAVPRVYGKHRFFPPLAAKPYTEVFVGQQYLRLLYCVGPGPLNLSAPRLGETPTLKPN